VTRPKTVLVIDDEPTVLNVAVRILERIGGYRALGAATGADAVARMDAEPDGIDLAFVDMSMPGMDGAATIEALRERRPDLPAIITSGYGEEETLARCVSLPTPGFLGKPYNPDGLVAAVQAFLGSPQA
jgi:CheY-like chemotaxis protein